MSPILQSRFFYHIIFASFLLLNSWLLESYMVRAKKKTKLKISKIDYSPVDFLPGILMHLVISRESLLHSLLQETY